MPVSRLRPDHHARVRDRESTINFYTEAGKLLYDRLISSATGIRHDYTMEIMLEREVRHSARKRRMRPGGQRWLSATAESREARRRRGQGLVQHESVTLRFQHHPPATEVAKLIAEVEAVAPGTTVDLDPMRQIEGETKRDRDARIKREVRALKKAQQTA